MKNRFNLDDNLPLKQKLEMHKVVITIRSIFLDSNKYCSQVFLGKCKINWLNWILLIKNHINNLKNGINDQSCYS